MRIRPSSLLFLLLLNLLWGQFTIDAVKPLPFRLPVKQIDIRPGQITVTPGIMDTLQIPVGITEPVFLAAPSFQGCSYDGLVHNLPVIEVRVPLGSGVQLDITSIDAPSTEAPTTLFAQCVEVLAGQGITGGWYPSTPVQKGEVITVQKQNYQIFQVYPLQVSADGRMLRMHSSISFGTATLPYADPNVVRKVSAFATSSMLASGSWYKLATTAEGMYRIGYGTIAAMGLTPENVVLSRLRLMTGNIGILPQQNSESRTDDLAELPVKIVDQNGNDRFDANDQVIFFSNTSDRIAWSGTYNRYFHQNNLYCDSSFYFLQVDAPATGQRISTISPTPTGSVSTLTRFGYYENDLYMPMISGRSWLGDLFDDVLTRDYTFPVPNLDPSGTVKVTVRLVAASTTTSSYTVSESGVTLGTMSMGISNPGNVEDWNYRHGYRTFSIPASSLADGVLNLRITYNKTSSAGKGWFDFVEYEYAASQNITDNPTVFFLNQGTGAGNALSASFTGSVNALSEIWDVTNPFTATALSASFSGTLNTVLPADTFRKFVVFNTASTFPEASYVGSVPNQNLHGLAQADYLIITHPNFLTEANRLAEFHRTVLGHSVHVIKVREIYQEFSGGKQDVSAIRDFVRMFYERSTSYTDQPKYLLMFGDASYDYKGRIAINHNYVPSYQSRLSNLPTRSYVSDDFFGFLDSSEGFWGEGAGSTLASEDDILYLVEGDVGIQNNYLDIAVGRIICDDISEAGAVVQKIIDYATNKDCFGDYKSKILLVADHKDADGNVHARQIDSYTGLLASVAPCMNLEKIYVRNYTPVSTPQGTLYPDAKDAFIKDLDKGSLIFNYTGHGGEVGLSNAQLLRLNDINSLSNSKRYPLTITATCEFSRFDDPLRRAAGELFFIKPDAGAIAMFTTVRTVYSAPNYTLNTNLWEEVFKYDTAHGRMPTMGEIFMHGLNATFPAGGASINSRNFTLFGDPGLTLAYPDLNVAITEINNLPAVTLPTVDTLASLSKVVVEGEIRDGSGVLQSGYNGTMDVAIFDKPQTFTITTGADVYSFNWQHNRIFSGTVTVTAGKFSMTFVVPKDVSYNAGTGKFSLYVSNTAFDGLGCSNAYYFGGTGDSSITDAVRPTVDLFMNDLQWADGGITDQNPTMLATVFDENGINMVGTGIGHELVAYLDGDEINPIILNDYYTAKKDSYQEGTIRYPFSELTEGEHTLKIKVWDVANNSAEDETHFLVAGDAKLALGHILNYPNPFTTHTQFLIEHNQNGRLLDIQIKIFTVSGKLVKTFTETFFPDGNLFMDLHWDGLDEYGDVIGKGVYIYQVTLRNKESGQSETKFEKLVILR